MAGALGLDAAAVRVITPDVGGGFGAKIATDRDTIAVAWAARQLGRPVRWVETRNENLLGMVHGRAQQHTVRIGGTRDGRILAYHLDIVQDCGAYPRFGLFLPTLTQLMASGVYDLPYCGSSYRVVVSNTTPISAYRGAGRPGGDRGHRAGRGPVRRRDRHGPGRGAPPEPGAAGRVPLHHPGRGGVRHRCVRGSAGQGAGRGRVSRSCAPSRRRRREHGDAVQLGIGVSCYVEITAGDYSGGETSRLVVDSTGAATVYTGSSPHGQGHQTAFAMLVTSELGIPMDRITVRHGDTDEVPTGRRHVRLPVAAARRQRGAPGRGRGQASRPAGLAASLLEASEADLELDVSRGTWQVRGDPDTALSWAAIAGAGRPGRAGRRGGLPAGQPDLPVRRACRGGAGGHRDRQGHPASGTSPWTTRAVVLNPVLAEGQRHGGIAQGVAQALLEEVRYDPDGNPLTSTLADYAAITATELPSFELVEMETPTTVNPLGVKGIGEAGTIGATPAALSAVVDAVAHLGVRHIDMPATPLRVWTAINEEGSGEVRGTRVNEGSG